MIFEKPENLKVKRIGGSWYLIYRNYEKVYLLNNTGLDMFLAIMDGTPTQTLLLKDDDDSCYSESITPPITPIVK